MFKTLGIAIVLLGTTPLLAKAQRKEDLWNGYITYVLKNRTTSKNSQASSELSMEATVTDGIATTKASERVSLRQSGMSWEGYAEGTGSVKFDLWIGDDGSYSIEIGMPVIKGKKTIRYPSKTVEEFMGMDDLLLLVENLNAGRDHKSVSGDTTWVETKETENEVFQDTYAISWNFHRGPSDVVLIVTPRDYDIWTPSPGNTEKESGNEIGIRLSLRRKDGGEPREKVKTFELELVNTSREPGISINHPLNPGNDFDMKFVEQPGATNGDGGQTQKVAPQNGKEGVAVIASYDGGAHATFKAYAILTNGQRVQGQLLHIGGATEILLPKRSKNSLIADVWLKMNGNPADDQDDEISKGNSNRGDGLTAYEEYRGVFTENEFVRLDPRKKELGVQVRQNDRTKFLKGLKLFESASDINVIVLNEQQLGEDRILNKNSTRRAVTQHALRLVNDNIGLAGRNEPVNKLGKRPKDSERVVVDVNHLRDEYLRQDSAAKQGGVSMPYTHEENVAVTVAHELTHGVGADHHGKPMLEGARRIYPGDKLYRIYGDNGREVILDSSLYIEPKIGKAGNEASGDMGCIMAYTASYNWAYSKSADGTIILEKVPILTVGKRLCTSKRATGINTKGYFGDAITGGNCLGAIDVKDR